MQNDSSVRIFTAFYVIIISFTSFLASESRASAENFENAPVQIQAALFVKLLSLNQNINGGDISVYVLNSPDFAAELKGITGVKIGGAKLAVVNESDKLPSSDGKPSAVYIGDASRLDEVIGYTRANKVLSITGIPGLVPKGITLGVALSRGKPKILLNLLSSKEEGIKWNRAIFKVSTTFK